MYRKHGLNVNNDEDENSAAILPPCIDDVSAEPCNDETQQPTAYTTINSQRAAALFILKAKEERMLTQNALSGLLKDITGRYNIYNINNHLINSLALMQQHNDTFIHEAKQALIEANIITTTKLDEMFDAVSNVDPFSGLETEYLQTKYFKENFRLLVRNTKSLLLKW